MHANVLLCIRLCGLTFAPHLPHLPSCLVALSPVCLPVLIILVIERINVITVYVRYIDETGCRRYWVPVPLLPCCQACIAIWIFIRVRL